jgi:alanine racemase
VDVTDIPGVGIGDEAVLIGSQDGPCITAWDIADLTGSIPWEVLCAISARVPRVVVS